MSKTYWVIMIEGPGYEVPGYVVEHKPTEAEIEAAREDATTYDDPDPGIIVVEVPSLPDES